MRPHDRAPDPLDAPDPYEEPRGALAEPDRNFFHNVYVPNVIAAAVEQERDRTARWRRAARVFWKRLQVQIKARLAAERRAQAAENAVNMLEADVIELERDYAALRSHTAALLDLVKRAFPLVSIVRETHDEYGTGRTEWLRDARRTLADKAATRDQSGTVAVEACPHSDCPLVHPHPLDIHRNPASVAARYLPEAATRDEEGVTDG